MKSSIPFFFLSFILFAVYSQKRQPTSKEIDQLVRREMAELHIPGMAVAVVQDGKLLHMGTYGIANIEWEQPVTKNTAFQIASVTKLFTSTLVMKYIQEGKISLD